MSDRSWFRAVLHPADFTAGGEVAFAHALKIALSAGAGGRFTIIHAGPATEPRPNQVEFPHVRSSLERWGLLAPGSQREDVFNELGVTVRKVSARGPNAVDAINDHIVAHPVDLLVLATRGTEGLPRWIEPSVSERLARLSKRTTLFVPAGGHGFVSAESGSVELRRILIPIATEPDPHAAVDAACALAKMLSAESVRIDLLHIRGHGPNPAPRLVRDGQFIPQCLVRTGEVVEQILAVARETQVDLIAMSTYGRHGFLDALRGSTTEQVVRRARCPVLAVPVTGRRRVRQFSFVAPEIVPSTT